MSLDSGGRVASASLDGRAVGLWAWGEPLATTRRIPGICVAASTAALRESLRVRAQRSSRVLQEDDKFCGVCGEAEIVRALASRAGALEGDARR